LILLFIVLQITFKTTAASEILGTATYATIPKVTVSEFTDDRRDPVAFTKIKHISIVSTKDNILFVEHQAVYIKHCFGYKACPFV
jgi:hypothetical protein